MMHYKFIKDFFSQGHARTLEIKKNVMTSFVVKGISIAVTFLLVPLTIDYVNPTQYGIWLTLSSIVAWFELCDVGFANGLRNRFAEAKATRDYAKARTYISTTYVCLGIIFLIIWVLFFVVNFFIDWTTILNAPPQMFQELSLVTVIIFTFFCIQFILKTIYTILIADQRPAKVAFWNMLGQVLTLLLIFILTKMTSGSLLYLALALGLSPILVLLCSSLWYYNNEYRIYRPSVHLFQKNIIKDILGLGIKFFITQVSALITYQSANIIIVQLFGPDHVTEYNIAYKYSSIPFSVLMIIITPLWSAYTDAYIRNDLLWMRNILKKIRILFCFIASFSILLLIMSPMLYHFWIGDSIKISFILSAFLCVYTINLMWVSIHIYILNGIGKIKLQYLFSIFEIIMFIPSSILLGKIIGINGVILTMILFVAMRSIWSPIQLRKILNNKVEGIWNK